MAKVTWSRVVMNDELKLIMNTLVKKLPRLDILEVSGKKWTIKGDKNKITHKKTTFPEYDLCEKPFPGKYNVVICEQVFEHLIKPYQAGRNVYSTLQDGGYFIISVPCLYPIHNYPIDCMRWTPLGLRYFLAECGWSLEKIWIGSWGNLDCIKAHLDQGGQVVYEADKHSLENDPKYPVMVWAIAQK